MFYRILLYFLLHHLGWLVASWIYGRSLQHEACAGRRSLAGMGLIHACVITALVPFFWSPRSPLLQGDRSFLHLCGVALAVVVGLLLLLGVIRFASSLKAQKVLGQCASEGDPLASPELVERFQKARWILGRMQRRIQTPGNGVIPLVLSESISRPVLFGLNPPRIHVPFSQIVEGRDIEGQVKALAGLAASRSYRAWMFLWWVAQIHIVLSPLVEQTGRALVLDWAGDAVEDGDSLRPGTGGAHAAGRPGDPWVARIGLAFPPGPIPEKGRVAGRRIPFWILPGTILTLAGILGTAGCGGLNIPEFVEFIMNKEIIGYSVHGFDPSVEFKAIPGEGGLLPDGLMVDTSRAGRQIGCATVRVPLGLFDHEKLVPFGAKAVRVSLAWRVLERAPSARELPAVKLASSEQGVIDKDGQQKLWTYYSRNVFLGEDGAMECVLDLPMLVHSEARVLESSRDVIYGPIIFIPEGWKIEFSRYGVEAMEPAEVPPEPRGEGERFVEWYRRNGFKPATIDLQWR